MARTLPLETAPIPLHDDYWALTRRPLNCLLFLIPLLLLYEYGVQHFGGATSEVRNGADYWMRAGLRQLGLVHQWLLPALVAGGLLVWQIVGRFRWAIAFETYLGMLAESLLFGLCLVAIGQVAQVASQQFTGQALAVGAIPHNAWERTVGFIGAGIYEEFLFRLCLLPLVVAALRLIRVPKGPAIFVAVLTTSVLFSAAHHVGPAADPFDQFTFVFRVVAGSFFAVLCLSRGFGITVGAHAAYDLLVGLALVTPVV